jgi:hypothetical protein
MRRFCSLAPGALRELDDWLALRRRGLEANYARLDRLLEKQSKQPRKETP